MFRGTDIDASIEPDLSNADLVEEKPQFRGSGVQIHDDGEVVENPVASSALVQTKVFLFLGTTNGTRDLFFPVVVEKNLIRHCKCSIIIFPHRTLSARRPIAISGLLLSPNWRSATAARTPRNAPLIFAARS